MGEKVLLWHKSSYSGEGGNECVEVAVLGNAAAVREWHKSSYSTEGGNECVEVAVLGHAAAVRDSKDPRGGSFAVRDTAWSAFLTAIAK